MLCCTGIATNKFLGRSFVLQTLASGGEGQEAFVPQDLGNILLNVLIIN